MLKCGVKQFEAWLEAPLLPADFRIDEQRRVKEKALLRGEI